MHTCSTGFYPSLKVAFLCFFWFAPITSISAIEDRERIQGLEDEEEDMDCLRDIDDLIGSEPLLLPTQHPQKNALPPTFSANTILEHTDSPFGNLLDYTDLLGDITSPPAEETQEVIKAPYNKNRDRPRAKLGKRKKTVPSPRKYEILDSLVLETISALGPHKRHGVEGIVSFSDLFKELRKKTAAYKYACVFYSVSRLIKQGEIKQVRLIHQSRSHSYYMLSSQPLDTELVYCYSPKDIKDPNNPMQKRKRNKHTQSQKKPAPQDCSKE